MDADPPRPRSGQLLASGIHGATVRRTDASTLVIRPRGGFLHPTATAPEGVSQPAIDFRRPFLVLDRLYRGVEVRPFASGDVVDAGSFAAEVLSVRDGRPLEVAFHFVEPLEAERWRWVIWRDGAYQPFPVPPVGGEVVVEVLPVS